MINTHSIVNSTLTRKFTDIGLSLSGFPRCYKSRPQRVMKLYRQMTKQKTLAFNFQTIILKPCLNCLGGQGSWRQFLTIPNMLKEFNPRLVGYALKDSLSHHRASQFNVGEAGAMSNDLPYMAGQLIKRIRSDARINIEKDWKVITYLFWNIF